MVGESGLEFKIDYAMEEIKALKVDVKQLNKDVSEINTNIANLPLVIKDNIENIVKELKKEYEEIRKQDKEENNQKYASKQTEKTVMWVAGILGSGIGMGVIRLGTKLILIAIKS